MILGKSLLTVKMENWSNWFFEKHGYTPRVIWIDGPEYKEVSRTALLEARFIPGDLIPLEDAVVLFQGIIVLER